MSMVGSRLDTGLSVNPDSRAAHTEAMRTVMLYMLCETFDLRDEEAMWASWKLDEVYGLLMEYSPHTIPLAARQEMLKQTFTNLLTERFSSGREAGKVVYDSNVVTATLDEWVDAFVYPIQFAYTIPPMLETQIRSLLREILSTLGVGDRSNPRGATHVPADLRRQISTITVD